jgi:hypothetical protein
VGDLDEFEGGLVQVAFKLLVAVEIAVGLFNHDVAFEQEALEDLLNAKPRITGVLGASGDVFEIQENGHGRVDFGGVHHVVARKNIMDSPKWHEKNRTAPGRKNCE